MTAHRDGDSQAALAQAESMSPEALTAMEERLLTAFAEHHARKGRPAGGSRRPWMAAAAALLLLAGGFAGWRALHAGPVRETATAEPVKPAEVERGPGSPVPSPIASGSTAGRPSAAPSVRPGPPSDSRLRARAARNTPVAPPAAFVTLPGAASLPRFESGSIVRVDLALSSLAAYGVDISAARGKGPVAADVLVGQDGEPRAIRLVSNSYSPSSSRSRQ